MFAKLELDILIHIRAPDTRILRPATTLTPSPIVATTPVLLTFSDRDIEHGAAGIDRLPPDPALFRRPVALGGIVKLAVLIAEADTGGVIGERRVMVCVKKIYPAQDIRIRRGWSRRRGVNVFDDSAGDIEITLWGGQVGVADSWSEFRTGGL
ncbi:hypothetical protein BC936DRAFT_148332 [Jimgerdemannia flammicorona]|uniref:Uncharacterized protein n=1 Tax=Jimgerdemannia flammicorona TaxID=994334 RepID=A0A433D3A3_9FUNG|nr:hypothetical protein BC936DRAFT_148332 [Jimgerdemannia flammicorona]